MSEQSPFEPEEVILRSVYLDRDVDRRLRSVAFTLGISPGELIRNLVGQGLNAWTAAGNRTLAERIEAKAAAKANPEG